MRYNEKADKFLESFYDLVGAKTWEQKLAVLEMKLGKSNFSHDPTPEQKVGCYEYELLEQQGLIELTLV